MFNKSLIFSFLMLSGTHLGFFVYQKIHQLPARPHVCTHEATSTYEHILTLTTADEQKPSEIGYVRYEIITQENYPKWFDEAGFNDNKLPICYISYININKEFQNDGWGRYLMHQVAQRATAQNCSAMVWMSFPSAVGFYEKIGAQKIGEIENQHDGEMLPTMRLRLA